MAPRAATASANRDHTAELATEFTEDTEREEPQSTEKIIAAAIEVPLPNR
jgi:hypothetical protein